VPSCALVTWLTAACVAGEPGPQADMATAAAGGPRARLAMEVLLVAILTGVVTSVLLSYPLLLDAAVGGVYDRPVRAVDLAAGGAAHLACGVAGGAVAVLSSAPRIERRASGGDADGSLPLAVATRGLLAAAAFALAQAWTSAWC
jgi:hypothetical protein